MTKEQLEIELKKYNLNCIDELESLMDDTLLTNEKFNLTAIKDKEKFRELMILDSLLPLSFINLDNKKVLDIGTGAGYPGLPLAIASKGEFTLLDSTKKKIDYIIDYVSTHNIKNVTAVSSRAEDYVKDHREEFDVVIARAVSSLNVLLELALPFVKVGGVFIAMKGKQGEEEISQSKRALALLGGEIASINKSILPESGEERINIVITKNKETNKKYPRMYKDIINKPL